MKGIYLTLGLTILMGASACQRIQTPDGKVPQEYLNAAKQLEGTYQGYFTSLGTYEARDAKITLTLDGDHPVLTYADAEGADILAPRCGSKIGQLESMDLDSSDTAVGSASFALNPGSCSQEVHGRSVTLHFEKSNAGLRVTAEIVYDSVPVWTYPPGVCSGPAGGGMICQPSNPVLKSRDEVLWGSFTRK